MLGAEQARCVATGLNGKPCRVHSGICPGCRRCLWHCEHRTEQAAAARLAGGRKSGRQKVGAKLGKIRVALPDQLPPLKTLDDAVRAASWLFEMGATGQLDPATLRECNRSVTTFKDAVNKADLLKRIKGLEARARERDRQAGRDV